MKVYIVTTGEYSDYHIVEVFTDFTKAQAYCAARNSNDYADYDIEEWDTDQCETQTNKPINLIWKGDFYRKGDNPSYQTTPSYVYGWESFETNNSVEVSHRLVSIYVTTGNNVDKETATKILIDRFHKWKYESEVG